ncbi:SCO0930 family lipoprotein [Streptomyces sp. NPDC001941]|uniref:SCO0930 family lipoprotein n=1 Tax=Streptomyces sp. NPDC001941 TaxID=3154659 RepID=UPI0033244658
MGKWRGASVAVISAALLATAGCGGAKDEARTPAAVRQADGGARPAGAQKARPAGQLSIWKHKDLGDVVTDSAGFTLYRFDKDTAQPPRSNCLGACATTWPVVPAEGAAPPPGVDPKLIGSVVRTDGTRQLTVGGWPMYRYVKDTEPKQTNGQGVGAVWFASAPDGRKASRAQGAAAPPPAASAPAATAPATTPPAAPPATALPGLSTRKDPVLGEIVVDRDGRTVYRFVKDSAWPMKTACTGACLEKWPVVAPVAESDARGITRKGYVTFSRPDGLKQQTIDCWPLYTFAGDAKPGDTNGQGVGGVWYAVSPAGKLVK